MMLMAGCIFLALLRRGSAAVAAQPAQLEEWVKGVPTQVGGALAAGGMSFVFGPLSIYTCFRPPALAISGWQSSVCGACGTERACLGLPAACAPSAVGATPSGAALR